MRISFENGRTEELFEDYKAMHKKIGAEKTRAVKKHMDRLRASGSFQTFLKLGLGKPHLLKENLAGCYAISISGNMRLIVKPVCEDCSPEALKSCDTIIVKGIGDYHGEKIEWLIP